MDSIKTSRKSRISRSFAYISKTNQLYIMMIPGILLIFVFAYYPLYGLVIAFKDYYSWIGIENSEWVGFKNFISFFQSKDFPIIVKNTLGISGLRLIFAFPSAIILALLINELKNGLFKRTIQTISYLPYFISWMVVSGIAYNFLSTDMGVLNQILKYFGAQPVNWYTQPDAWWPILTITTIWKSMGWGSIAYLAAITSISPELYEAATIDGASKLKQVRHITIPGMMPVISITLILTIGSLIRDDFEQIYALVGANAILQKTTDVLGTWVFRTSILQSDFSNATAVGLFQSVISLIMIIGANYFAKKTDNPGLW